MTVDAEEARAMVSSSSLLDDELGRARSDTPDSQATIPDPPDESYYRDFARLVPVNRQARIAFSEVAERMKVEAEWAPHAAHFVHIDAVKRSLTELTGSSETDASVDSLHDADASSSSSSAAASAAAVPPVWTGYYRLNLERPPLRPHVGWVLGSYLNNADLLLTARRQLYRVRGRHARLAFNLQSYSLLAFADFGHAILLEGKEELRNGQRVLWAGETAISLGELSYKLVRTTVSDSTLREQLNHWRDTIGTTSLEPPAYLAPTPSPDDYEYNGYIIKAVFAQGSTCSVSAGVDKRTGAAVAVKKMIRNGRNRDMVRNEIEVLKYLANHPRICGLVADLYSGGDLNNLGFHRVDEIYLIYTPLADERFQDLISKRQRRSEGEHVRFFKQGLEGLAFIHAKGLMHRDIKPGNMAIVPAEPARLVILDFGVATWEVASRDHRVGTIPYLAPEVIALRAQLAHTPYTCAVDLWGYGLSFYQLFCGRTAFWNEISPAHHVRIVGHLAARPTVEPLLRDLLQWDPRHRISAAAALDSDLLRPVDSRIRDAYDAANGKRQRDESPMHINQRAYVRTTSLN